MHWFQAHKFGIDWIAGGALFADVGASIFKVFDPTIHIVMAVFGVAFFWYGIKIRKLQYERLKSGQDVSAFSKMGEVESAEVE